jgi:cytidylate kinase
MDRFVITIGRQLGSGGRLIGERLADRLGIACYDRELIDIASRESGLGAEFFERADEKGNFSVLGSYFGFRGGYMGHGSSNCLCNEALFKIQSDVIRGIAERESCIFVGRCADYILRDCGRLLMVFVTADRDDRIGRVAGMNGVSEREAAQLIEQADRRRAAYYNYYSNKRWGDAASYDLCINSSRLGIDGCVEFIERCAGDVFNFGS